MQTGTCMYSSHPTKVCDHRIFVWHDDDENDKTKRQKRENAKAQEWYLVDDFTLPPYILLD